MSDLDIRTAQSIENTQTVLKDCAAKIGIDLTALTGLRAVCKASPVLSQEADKIRKLFREIDEDLKKAASAAYALAGSKKKGKLAGISFSVGCGMAWRECIRLDAAAASSDLADMKGQNAELGKRRILLTTTAALIGAIRIMNQDVNSLDDLMGVTGLSTVNRIVVKAAIDSATDALGRVCRSLGRISAYLDLVIKEMTDIVKDLAAAEEKGRMTLFEDTIRQTSQIQDDAAARKQGDQAVKELEAAQAEYVALYGVESETIKAEIARIKGLYTTEAIHLTTKMTEKQCNQHSYEDDELYGMCCATAYAIGLSIINGGTYTPTKYHRKDKKTDKGGGYNHWDDGGVKKYQKKFSYKTVYEDLKAGKPVILHYYYTKQVWDSKQKKYVTKTCQHWILINGVRAGANIENLQPSDFTAIDPGYGKEFNLGTILSRHDNTRVDGIKRYN
ncbi:MAG: hypothetical protein IJL66_06765 [Lachnospiraceae bacterium]|nr:hypothetical protein [Lachnospiraceae bacterium]